MMCCSDYPGSEYSENIRSVTYWWWWCFMTLILRLMLMMVFHGGEVSVRARANIHKSVWGVTALSRSSFCPLSCLSQFTQNLPSLSLPAVTTPCYFVFICPLIYFSLQCFIPRSLFFIFCFLHGVHSSAVTSHLPVSVLHNFFLFSFLILPFCSPHALPFFCVTPSNPRISVLIIPVFTRHPFLELSLLIVWHLPCPSSPPSSLPHAHVHLQKQCQGRRGRWASPAGE